MAKVVITKEGLHTFYCPACKCGHYFKGTIWKFNGDLEKPTVTPSMKVTYGVNPKVCHFFLKNGKIEYCNDSTHELRGQTIDMVDYE